MTDKLASFVKETERRFGSRPRSNSQLMAELRDRGEYLDAAVLGGYSIRDIVEHGVSSHDIPPDVLHAFHLQYPGQSDFCDFIRQHAANKLELAGIVNGIKGKLFEVEYTDFLNHGQLPSGHVAELAYKANQPGWDLAIRDAHGHIVDHLQAKASDSLAYVKAALAEHPHIDVVCTHEVFEKIGDPGLRAHIIDSGIYNTQLTDHVKEGLQHLTPEFHLPLLAYALIAVDSCIRYRRNEPLDAVLKDGVRRASFTTAGTVVAHFVILATGLVAVGLPAGIFTRLGLSRLHKQRQFVKKAAAYRQETRKQLLQLCPAYGK